MRNSLLDIHTQIETDRWLRKTTTHLNWQENMPLHFAPKNVSLLLYFADSAQTEYCPTFHFPSVCVCTGVTSHISYIYKGINAMFIIRGPIKPYSE